MYRQLCLAGLVLIAGPSAFAQDKNWSGWHAGVHGGGARSKSKTNFSDASRFCHTSTTTSGTGTGTATCDVNDGFATTSASSFVPDGANRSTSASAAGAATSGSFGAGSGVGATGSATASVPGTQGGGAAGAGAGAADHSAANGGTISQSTAAGRTNGVISSASRSKSLNDSGFAEAVAIGLVNAFDLNGADGFRDNSFGYGAHLGHLSRLQNGVVFGIEGDLTAMAGRPATYTQVSNFKSDGNLVAGSNAFGADGGTVTPFASTSSTTSSFYSQSVSLDTQFLGSLRAKLGYTFGNYFPYVTAGIALARYKVRAHSELQLSVADVEPNGFAGNVSTPISLRSQRTFRRTAFGGVIGGGISTIVFQNVIISAEGLYYIFDDEVDISSGFLNDIGENTITLGNVIEGRLKVSIPLQ